MREVTIPEGWNPCKITVNNVTYEYPAGQTVEVPDEIAALIEQAAANQPQAKDQRQVYSLEFGPEDAGKVLTVNDAETEAIWARNILWINATVTEGADHFIPRLDKTFREIYTAMQNKILCVVISRIERADSNTMTHSVVEQASYSPSEGCTVNAAGGVFICSSQDDYPELRD